MGKNIGNANLNVAPTNVAPGAATPDGSFSVTEGDFEIDGAAVAVTMVSWTPSGCSLAGHNFVAGASAGIIATATKVKSGNMPVVLEGDQGVCAGSFVMTASPFTPMPCSCTIKVDDAGQTIVQGN